ncbi:hypothetical protein [Leisingera caerulea]|uniref:hypothetical protein n=1 Tax=Leisingera caerulea TaxID=506591 RepID=UPI003F4AD0E1
MIVEGANGPFKLKQQLKEKEVLRVLRFVASSPSAHSRQNSLVHMDAQGFAKNPVHTEGLLRFYLGYLLEKVWLEKDRAAGDGVHFEDGNTRKIMLVGY